MKKSLTIILVLIALIILGYYLVSPAFRVIEKDDPSPLIIRDALSTMTEEEKSEFEKAVMAKEDDMMSSSDSIPSESQLLSQGIFKERAHEVKGQALLINDEGSKILRFEDFETINGPNLHIYLASSLSDDDFIDLGKIKATSGNVNYEIPDGIDTEKYNKVLVWCVPFKVLFSYAELK